MDVIVMFKLLVLQQLYNISDEALEYQVSDRLSFMQFLDFGLADEVPDATTVWLFRKQLTEQALIEPLFEQFDEYLIQQGYAAQGGQIVDATLIPVPKHTTARMRINRLSKERFPHRGKTTRINVLRKIAMLDGRKRGVRATSATKITSALMPNMG